MINYHPPRHNLRENLRNWTGVGETAKLRGLTGIWWIWKLKLGLLELREGWMAHTDRSKHQIGR